jgi:hypothetical protein
MVKIVNTRSDRMTDKLKSLSTGKKVLLGVGAFLLLSTAIGAANPAPEEKEDTKTITTQSVKGESTEVKDETPKPKIETQMVEESTPIPFQSVSQDDPTLAKGKTSISVTGVNGTKVMVYKVIYTDGVQTSRELDSEYVSKQPVNEIKKIGTKVATAPQPLPQSNCSPNYSGCVPIASDVDCAGGSGNGPAYVSGPVSVIGADIYDLDRDGDGLACE